MANELHVIFGTGPVGMATMEELVGVGLALAAACSDDRRVLEWPALPEEARLVAALALDEAGGLKHLSIAGRNTRSPTSAAMMVETAIAAK